MLFDTLKSLDKLLPEMKIGRPLLKLFYHQTMLIQCPQPLLIATWIAIVTEKLYHRNSKEDAQ